LEKRRKTFGQATGAAAAPSRILHHEDGGGKGRLAGVNGMRVFVVEDDAGSRRFITWLLALRTRHEVFAFETAEAALEELARLAPCVLLTDLNLPGRSGEDLARAAAQLPQPPRVVLMSADPGRLEQARPLSDTVLAKPFSISELLLAFEPLLTQNLEEA
jgi:CheY-like chemotaxis protein